MPIEPQNCGASSGTTDGGATETTLAAILVELGQKLEPGGEVALNAATLAALENITVTVSNPTEAGLAKEVTLAAVLVELGQKYEGGAISLDAGTLAALETVTVLQGTSPWVVNVDNFPVGGTGLTDAELRATPVPISGTVTANLGTIDGVATETTLASILTELGQKLEPGGEVALNAATLTALENITVTVSNPAVDSATETTLASILVELGQKYEGGPVTLDAATLAALETVTVLQGTSPWVVNVDNFPVGTTGLTDTELRATPVPVETELIQPLTDVELRASPISTNVLNDTAVNKFATEVRTTKAFTVSTSGDNTLITPSTGTKLRVFWVGYSSSETNTAEILTKLRFGVSPDIYRWYMGAPGAFMHWEPIDGGINEELIINLSGAQTVQVNVTYLQI